MLTVASIVTAARGLVDDRLDDSFSHDDLGEFADGTNTRFKLFNRFVVDNTTDGAPADPVLLVNLAPVAYTVAKETGIITATVAPAAGSLVQAEYYHTLLSDAMYVEIVKQAHAFFGNYVAGVTDSITISSDTAIEETLFDSATHYVGSRAAKKLSTQTAWFYSAGAGGKNFNKDTISAKFKALADELMTEALKAREDVYTRHGKRDAPAIKHSLIRPVLRYQPRR